MQAHSALLVLRTIQFSTLLRVPGPSPGGGGVSCPQPRAAPGESCALPTLRLAGGAGAKAEGGRRVGGGEIRA